LKLSYIVIYYPSFIVDMAIPLKQGLKHNDISYNQTTKNVDMAIPLKQGLKHINIIS